MIQIVIYYSKDHRRWYWRLGDTTTLDEEIPIERRLIGSLQAYAWLQEADRCVEAECETSLADRRAEYIAKARKAKEYAAEWKAWMEYYS